MAKKIASEGRIAAKKGSRNKKQQGADIDNDLVAAAAATPAVTELEPTVDDSLFEPLGRASAGFLDQEEMHTARTSRPMVEVDVDESHQLILKRIAEAESENPELQTDPIRETLKDLRALLPDEGRGMSFRLLSDRITARKGRRNWQPLLHPVTGKEIKIQGLTLAWMPKLSAKRRNRHYQEIGNEQIREAQENFKDRMREITNAAERQGVVGYAVLDQDEVLRSNDNRKGRRDLYGHREQIGVSVERGELRERALEGAAPFDGNTEAAIEAEVQRRLRAMEGAGERIAVEGETVSERRRPRAREDYQPRQYAGRE